MNLQNQLNKRLVAEIRADERKKVIKEIIKIIDEWYKFKGRYINAEELKQILIGEEKK